MGSTNLQLERLNVYLNEVRDSIYIPCCVRANLEPATINTIRNGSVGPLYTPNNFVFGQSETGNNWAKGTILKSKAGACDCNHGSPNTSSQGGRTGAGMFSVMPSAKVSEAFAGPYNATISTKHWIQDADETCLHNTWVRTLRLGYPTHRVLNYLVSAVMSGVSACLCFPGELNSDMCKLPRVHSFRLVAVSDLTQQMLDSNSRIASCDRNRGRLLTCSAILQSETDPLASNRDQMKHIQTNNARAALCSVPPQSLRVPVTLLGNSTAIQEILDRVDHAFGRLSRVKAELEVVEAASNMHDLIAEYRHYRHASASAGEGERRREGLS
ncbi:tubulin nucleotide-binding domain-like protein [Aspergillus indologenus CBS 114.80]|uniref:Tubulin nucleotide-binding domain-like protein n=1 Tax=Aspergillus indologenus CBS 114.80 TaxID=1450541 RepID=A0A2V5IMK6_9EURO|nr:tubulin nucleotide-binding domain-like protein [Aspergillus indologenus CBS 114.80]